MKIQYYCRNGLFLILIDLWTTSILEAIQKKPDLFPRIEEGARDASSVSIMYIFDKVPC